MRDLRGLLLLLAAAMVVDTAGYSAITPLLPHFAAEYGLSRAGAGVLTAAYPVGTVVFALPAAWLVSRVGAKRVTLVALALMGLASLGFAFAAVAPLLAVARLCQGAAAAGVWAAALAWAIAVAPDGRRSEVIGTVTGAAIIGAVGGPALGVLGDWFGIRAVFATFVLVPAVLAVLVLRVPAPPVVDRSAAREAAGGAGARATGAAGATGAGGGVRAGVRGAWRDPHVRLGIWLMTVPALAFGVLNLLVPLRLGGLGWGASAIGAVFLVTAVTEALASPVAGRAGDRHGVHAPAWVALVGGSVGLALLAPSWGAGWAFAVLVPVTGSALGSLWTPAMTLLSAGAEERGLDPAFGFGVANLAWGVGAAVANVGGGALADVAGDWSSFAVVAVLAAGAAVLVRVRARPPALARVAAEG